jgi:hypothetical protein
VAFDERREGLLRAGVGVLAQELLVGLEIVVGASVISPQCCRRRPKVTGRRIINSSL